MICAICYFILDSYIFVIVCIVVLYISLWSGYVRIYQTTLLILYRTISTTDSDIDETLIFVESSRPIVPPGPRLVPSVYTSLFHLSLH
jgi:hypothetical protein